MPERIQLRRTKGYRKPEGAVVVSRPTKWGNPYRWTDIPAYKHNEDGEARRVPDEARRQWAVTDFKASLDPEYGWSMPGYPSRDEIRAELRGRDLACWCPLPEPGKSDHCHAAVLLEIANSPEGTS